MERIGALPAELAERANLRARTGWPARRQQLIRDSGKGKDVRRRTPLASFDTLGRRIRTTNGGAKPDPFECLDDPEAGRAGLVGCHEDVARMERAMANTSGSRKVERAGQLGDERQHLVDRRGRVVPERHVERFGGDVLLGAVRDSALDSCRNRFDDRGVEEPGLSRESECLGERLRLFRCDVETEDLHRHEAIARRLVGAEHRTESADADLMQHPEGAERGRRSECCRVVSGQVRKLLGWVEKM